MPQELIPLTDEELQALAPELQKDPALMNKLTSDERRRLAGIAPTKPLSAAEQRMPGLVGLGASDPGAALDTLTGFLPTVGGAIGGIAGSVAGPAGAMGGAALGGAGGEGFRQAIQTYRGRETPRQPVEAVKGMGKQAAIQGAAEGAGIAVGAGMKKAGPWLMQSALKPTQTLLSEYKTTAPKLVQTLLDEGVNVTSAGLAKLQQLFAETNDDIASAIAGSDAQISKHAVASYVPEVAAKTAQQVNPARDLEAVASTVDEFMKHPAIPGATMNAAEAQAMKRGTYQAIGKKYGEVSSAGIETQKALARGLKEQIAEKVPGVAALNARDSSLMAAQDAVGRRVALSGNRDPVGFAWVSQNPTTFIAALIDRNPAVKSFLARGLYQQAATAAGVVPQMIRLAVQAIAGGEDETSPDPASQ